MSLKKLNVVNLNTTDRIELHSSYFPLFITLFWNIIFCDFSFFSETFQAWTYPKVVGFFVIAFFLVENVKTFYIAVSECGKK